MTTMGKCIQRGSYSEQNLEGNCFYSRYYYINCPFQIYLIFRTEEFTHVEYTRNESNRLNLRFMCDGYNVGLIRFHRVLQFYEMIHYALLVAVSFDVIVTYICYLYVSWSWQYCICVFNFIAYVR